MMHTLTRFAPRAVGVLALVASAQAAALTLEYGERPPALAECDQAAYRGERQAANQCYSGVLVDHTDPRLRAEAARALGDVRAANELFREAVAEYPDDAVLRERWGRLYAQTHQANVAVQLFFESLERDPDHLPATLGLAQIAMGRFEDRARG